MLLGELATTSGVTRLKLEPLSVAAVARLADGSALDADVLYRRTGGNPFFVTAVVNRGTARFPRPFATQSSRDLHG